MAITMTEYVFAVPGANSIIDNVADDGRSVIARETLDEIRVRYPGAERVSWPEWQAERARRQDIPITWERVTEQQYNEMRDVLPPLCFTSRGFLVGEPVDHHAGSGRPRFQAYIARLGHYYRSTRPLTVQEYRDLCEGANTIGELRHARGAK